MVLPVLGAMGSAVVAGLVAGGGFGLLNLWASHWTARKVLGRGERFAATVMIAGFLGRLGVLAAVILVTPRGWMRAEAFVLTFLSAFGLGLVVEARRVIKSGSRTRAGSEAPLGSEPQAS